MFEIKGILGTSDEFVWKVVFGSLRDKNKIAMVEYGAQAEHAAVSLSKKENIPKTDALLIEIAKEKGLILVSRNFHFDCAKGLVHVCKPEELF